MKNRYHPRAPRTALKLVAAGMTAMTLGVMVVLPAKSATVDVRVRALQGVDGTHAITAGPVRSAQVSDAPVRTRNYT